MKEGKEMELQEAIEHTKNKGGMKQCITGLMHKIEKHRGQLSNGYKFALSEFVKHYKQAKEAWLNGDLHTVAEFFGLYIS